MADQRIEQLPAPLRAALLEAIRELRERGVDVTLVGGLAVNLLASAVPPSSGRLDDPSLLAAIGRSTQDIDLAVAAQDAARVGLVLQGLGYLPLADRPGYERDRSAIDVLPLGGRRSSGGAMSLPIDGLGGADWQLDGEPIKVASCSELIALKAVAWSDRRRNADLADIGTLALIDQAMGGQARESLDEGLEGRLHSELRRDLRTVGDRFRRPDATGPRAFVQEVVQPRIGPAPLASPPDWEDAVMAVLSGLGEE